MRVFTATELARMRATQDAAMQDICQVLSYSAQADEYGNPTPRYEAGVELACGFEPLDPREVQDSGQVPVIDAHIRLPISTPLDPRDRIRIAARYGEDLATAEDYEVVGPVRRGPSGLVVDVVLVTEE